MLTVRNSVLKVGLLTLLALGLLTASAAAKKIEVAVGWTKPPYVIEKNNTGFEVELLRNIFKSMGHTFVPIYVPYGRSYYLLQIGKVDATMTLSSRLDISPAVMSDPYINYHNVAVSLKGRGITIDRISELANYSLVGFQNASIFLGDEYKAASERSRFYVELPDQKKQVEMLLLGRTDVVVMDINIFNYLSREIIGSSHMGNVDVHRIFPVNAYRLGIYDPQLRDEFNKALVKYKNSPDYQKLVEQYEFID